MNRGRVPTATILIIGALLCLRCGGGSGGPTTAPTSPSPTVPPGSGPTPTPAPIPSAPRVFVGAGDIGLCGSPGTEQTARLLEGIGGTVFTAGDNAYVNGTMDEYNRCYDPFWGRTPIKSRTRPVPGNHEYGTPNAAGYFQYFGGVAGTPGSGYYSWDEGDWHIIALNSVLGDISAGSPEGLWLQADLAESAGARCTLAYWHYPLYTSGPSRAESGNGRLTRDFWRILYAAGADVVINGHDHLYERFAPQDPDARPDSAKGIREFIVGTGGATFYAIAGVAANSERRITDTYGVLKMTLQSGSYQWDFIPVSGGQGDSGTGTCH